MDQKLNVIFIGSFLYPHGYAATKRKQQFLHYIIEQGSSARVLITLKWARGNELNKTKGCFKNIKYEVLGNFVKKNITFIFTFPLLNLKVIYKLFTYKLKNHKNILVAFGIDYHTLIPIIFAYLLGYKIVFDITEDFSLIKNIRTTSAKIKYVFIVKISNYLKFNIASGISVITQKLFSTCSLKFKYKDKVRLIPISADNIYFDYNKVGSNSNEFQILYSGTYGEKEGLSYLFYAFRNVSNIIPEATLVLTGNCPETFKKELSTKYHVYNKVKFTNRLKEGDYFNVLYNADVLLMTRKNSEFANAGFPYKLGEYLATGKPVIATSVSDITIYLKNMISAIIVKPENVDVLTKAILFIYYNKDKALKIGEAGREVCKKYFNPKKNSKLFYDLLVEC